ncbi:hypothetical protein BK674_14625 [Pseudomonas moraviensis]|uniref:Glycosyltransferase RgtA/B/C/D-like domain-containing protein n=1 Tax=Pseudomonas moraviensis TaxID=321662 RepID=A0A423NPQ7_9PSED|nr:hypothetical protein [Pseudomonas moraviensis]ROO00268.1 hypothetical protein BK674_14625 [Pseudomonas moraviensis]
MSERPLMNASPPCFTPKYSTVDNRRPFVRRWLVHIIPAIVVIVLLWIPFGFTLTGLIEEWGVLGLFVQHGVFFLADPSSPLPLHAMRPLTILPHAVAFCLDNDSFFFWHVLLMLALLIKGSTVSYITEKLTGSTGLAIIASILVIVYPADTMQLSFRGLHINWALSLALLGSTLFLHALSLQSKLRRCLISVAASTLFAAACFMYEASLLLACIPVLVLFCRDGLKPALMQIIQKLPEHAIWLAGALAYLAYAIRTAPLVNSYQASVAGTDWLTTIKATYPKLFSVGLLRSTFGGWFDAIRITAQEYSNYDYLIFGCVILFLTIAVILKLTNNTQANYSRNVIAVNIRLAISGIILILLGYFPFLISYSHLLISQRTFLFATPGAALLVIALLGLGYSISKHLTYLCAGFFVAAGLSFQLYQFHHYVEISKIQAGVLNEVTEIFDGKIENKTLLILDYGNRLDYRWMLLNEGLTGSLSFLYNKPVTNVQVCHMPSRHWQYSDELGRKGQCVENAQDWTFQFPTSVSGPGFPASVQHPDRVIPKSSIVTVEIGRNQRASGQSQPASVVQGPIKERRDSILETLNSKTRFISFRDEIVNDRYDWTFGKWWSMEIPTHGTGWRETEWEVRYFNHQPTAWKVEKEATLLFEFAPKQATTYELKGTFNAFSSISPSSSMSISLNGKALAVQWSGSGDFQAMIDEGVLTSGTNTLEFNSPTDDSYYGLSARLAGVHIAPL